MKNTLFVAGCFVAAKAANHGHAQHKMGGDKMKMKIDSPVGRRQYGKRLGCIEPVFGNITTNKGMDKFTLRGQSKVNAQWQLYCLVHNIEKLRDAMH